MPNESNSTGFASGNAGDKLSAAASEAKARIADLGWKAADTADQARSAAAARLSNAGEALEEGAAEGGNRVRRAAHATAKALSGSADYIRDNSARDMMDDAMDVVKNNPGVALLGAAALGFVVGRAFSSRD